MFRNNFFPPVQRKIGYLYIKPSWRDAIVTLLPTLKILVALLCLYVKHRRSTVDHEETW
jgi:hypothetical protein